ncbi:hypothetical protein HQ520_12470 [bacterium]|nr:hypothetical protein [bacterium]
MSISGRIGAALAVAFLLCGLAANARTVSVEVVTPESDLIFSTMDGYDLVELETDRSGLDGEIGEPWLPVRSVQVLLPPGAQIRSVQSVVLIEKDLGGPYEILPAQPAVPVSAQGPHPLAPPKAGAYASALPARPNLVGPAQAASMRGYRLAAVQVYPVDYIPAEKRLVLRERILVSIELEPAMSPLSMAPRRSVPVFDRLIESTTLNASEAEVLGYFSTEAPLPAGDDVKYLLIGDDATFPAFQPLLDWKTKKGVPAEAIDVDTIYASYSGADSQEKIKACIRDYVLNKGTVYVVLAGDNTIVPDRDCYGSVNSGDYVDSTIPTDLYYADIDDLNWNDDGDGMAAEVSEDSIDMAPDCFVGRLPIRTSAHATAIVNKTLAYEKQPPASDFCEKMLLSGVMLWNAGDAEAKSEYLYSDWVDPYWGPVRDRFYDTNTDFAGGAAYEVSTTNMNALLADGYNFLHMATHGNQTIWATETGGYYYSSTASSLNHPGKYVNVVTNACITNAFENSYGGSDPCLSEAFIRNPNGGAVSYVGSSRYGWGYATLSSHGTSFQYNRMIYQYLFTDTPADHPQEIGAVLAQAKTYFIGSSGYYGANRWIQFSLNLMGDPELSLYTSDPLSFSPTHDSATFPGSQTFEVETGVAGARVCLSMDSDVYVYGLADGSGHYEAMIAPSGEGTMDVTITAANHIPYEGTVTVSTDSDGHVSIEESVVAPGHILHVTLLDGDLSGQGSQIVTFEADSGDSEIVVLAEGVPASFAGNMTTTAGIPSSGNGTLEVSDGDTITLTYDDLDDGSGFPATVQDTALVDGGAPGILNLLIDDIRHRTATVTFDTDEPTSALLEVGLAAGGPYTISETAQVFSTSHEFDLRDLSGGTDYFLRVTAWDSVGNGAIDDNEGSSYSFSTRANWRVPFFEDFESGDLEKWEINYDGSGNVPVVEADTSLQGGLSPRSGSYVARLGDQTDGMGAHAMLDLLLDLSGVSEAELRFSWVAYSLYTSECIQLDIWDGSWHTNVNGWAWQGWAWEDRALDLSGYNLIDDFVVRFHSYMDSPESGDAAYLDDVYVTLPDRLTILPADALSFSGDVGGPCYPTTGEFDLVNGGSAALEWFSDYSAGWLSLSTEDGTLSGLATENVTVLPDVISLGGGDYTAPVLFTNETTSVTQVRTIHLSLVERPARAFEWFAMHIDPGWSLEGAWEFGTPEGAGTQEVGPPSAHTGYFVYGYNLSGNYSDSQPAYYLVTQGLDCGRYRNVSLSFYRWLGVEGNVYDHSMVEVSADGSTWHVVWQNPVDALMDREWVYCEYDISLWADFEETVYVRWSMGPTNDSMTDSGWYLDDVALLGDLDTTPPVFSNLSSTASPLRTGDGVLLSFTASEILGGEPSLCVNDHDASFVTQNGNDYTFSYTVLVGDPDGPAEVAVAGVDRAGNTGLATSTALLTIDQTPPSGWVRLDDGAAATSVTAVRLALLAADTGLGASGVADMRLRNESAAWSVWQPVVADLDWTIETGDGARTIEAEFRDSVGNVFATSDTITLDTLPPATTLAVQGGGMAEPVLTLTWLSGDLGQPCAGVSEVRIEWTYNGCASRLLGTFEAAGTANFDTRNWGVHGEYCFTCTAVDAVGNAETTIIANRVEQTFMPQTPARAWRTWTLYE